MKSKKVLIVESDLVKAMKYEKVLDYLGFDVIGIAAEYITAMLLTRTDVPEVVFCNPRLSFESEVLDIASELRDKFDCEIVIMERALRSKEKMDSVSPYSYIENPFDTREYEWLLSDKELEKVA